ncbi:DUF294 nucleotidyltransferase-like domain-containing protein [Deinococcus navajonensis]|uniref:DUF294 nucleotidyltransferase-like domain-containing protein n=1 Tax=Deinococcus navajonensis TaxID=309884 RepID=A0ABV8XJK4_9DEIO
MRSESQARLESVIPLAVERIQATQGAYAALWCGSAARGEATPWSDLDFHVLVTSDERWRSSFVIEGVPVEVFYNPIRKVRAMLSAQESATVVMFKEGRPVWPHRDLEVLQKEAATVYEAGPTPKPVPEFTRFILVDSVMDARAALHDPIHAQVVMAALGPLIIRPLYAARGWWEVKPQHWLADLAVREPDVAAELAAVLKARQGEERQVAFESLALRVTGTLTYQPFESDRQVLP